MAPYLVARGIEPMSPVSRLFLQFAPIALAVTVGLILINRFTGA